MAVAFTFLLLLSMCCLVCSQPGFISLDCGGKGEYNDTHNISWTSDQHYIEAGEIKSIAVADFERPLTMLRSFPQGKRNCYSLSALQGRKYIIRGTFLYGNYDGLQSQPRFELLLDANHWDSVVINNTREMITKEAIVMARSASISVCVARSADDTPFISALELRPIKPSMYPAVGEDYSLLLYWRGDYGSQPNSAPIRYPDDEFDRIWTLPGRPENLVYINTTDDIQSGIKFEIPSSVYRTALVTYPKKSGDLNFITAWWTVEPNSDYYVVLCFAEIQKLILNAVREFNVSIKGVPQLTVTLTKYRYSFNFYEIYQTQADTLNISLDPTSQSTVGPILNAGEIYKFSGLLINGTYSEDAGALADIARQLNLEKEWTGDPCLPQQYSWDWVICNVNSTPRIVQVDLSGKGLNGTIPSSFGNLSALIKLDLSGNTLIGPIPEVLANLSKLKELNLAENKLNGSVPIRLADKQRSGELVLRLSLFFSKHVNSEIDILSSYSYIVVIGVCVKYCSIYGNENLCEPGACKNTHKSHGNKALLVSLIIAGAATLATIIAVIVFIKCKSRSTSSKGNPIEPMYLDLVNLDGCRSFTYEEVRVMSGGFEREIGKGGYGPVFHGYFRDMEVAIKILSDKSHQGITEFSNEVNVLSKLHHKNLVKFFGYCTDAKTMILIYEYMRNGDLRQRLDAQGSLQNDLDWEKRLKIALDAAHGLEYLHLGCKPAIIHRDVKSSNILLNEGMDAKIGDFGISKMGPLDGATHVTTLVKGTAGYLDPEYYTEQRLTEKSDVYSFGVVLMEIICGRRPLFVDSSTGEQVHITGWVRPALLKGDIESIADPTLLNKYNVDAMWKVAELAMVCTSPYSLSRPAMNEVVLELKEAIRFQTGFYANLKLHEFDSPVPLLHPSQESLSILDSDISLYPVAR